EDAPQTPPRVQPHNKVPLLRELDLTGLRIDHEGKAAGPKEPREPSRNVQYPSELKTAAIRVEDLRNYCYDQDTAAKIARQIDPDQQQLLLVWWYSWTEGKDALAVEVREDRVDFILRLGRSPSSEEGKSAITYAPTGPT